MTRASLPLLAVLVVLLGCPSAYQRTYQQETQKLEAQAGAERAAETAAHAEASRYAAIVYFATGSATITADGQRELRWFVEKMQPYPQAVILVQGFADSTGAEATNQQLSGARADAVKTYLASQGIAPARIMAQAVGTASPAATNVTTQGRRDNRRVEVTVR
jgi:outer membrane protein OmpA-like peptidoglycan-associated protein